MRWRNPNSSASNDEENPYWMSFSDMMASLLVIFMLAAAALMLQLATKSQKVDEQVDEVARAEKVRKQIIDEIVEELKQKQIVVEKSDNDTVLHIPESSLRFASGSSDIPETLQNNVREIGNVLYEALNAEMSKLLVDYSKQVQSQTNDRLNEWNNQTREYTTNMVNAVKALSDTVDEIETKISHRGA